MDLNLLPLSLFVDTVSFLHRGKSTLGGEGNVIANNLLRRVRDYAQVRSGNFITGEVAKTSLGLLEIDPNGLDEMDIRILETICSKFGGGPVGLSTIAVSVGEEPDTIEEAYEPFLIMEGYLERTPKGRVATALAYERLGLKK